MVNYKRHSAFKNNKNLKHNKKNNNNMSMFAINIIIFMLRGQGHAQIAYEL